MNRVPTTTRRGLRALALLALVAVCLGWIAHAATVVVGCYEGGGTVVRGLFLLECIKR